MHTPAVDSKIDDLYRGLLTAFTAARTALARTLTGDEARRVKKLSKPTVVPWAINQVYWEARPIYVRLLKEGARLRDAQIASLGGKRADVRAAADAHRRALADAVKTAERLAAAAGLHPPAEVLTRALEAISLAAEPSEPHGRLTRPPQPAGFEAFAGVKVRSRPQPSTSSSPSKRTTGEEAEQTRAAAHDARVRERAVKDAQAAVEQARTAEAAARLVWEQAKRDLEAAELAVRQLSERAP